MSVTGDTSLTKGALVIVLGLAGKELIIFLAPYSASRLGVGKNLEEDIAWTSDLKRYSIPYNVMLSNKN